MTVLFFDTSALVRRYDPLEPNAGVVEALCDPRSAHLIAISRLTPVEVAAAFSKKVRTREWDAADRDQAWELFLADCGLQYQIVALDDAILDHAARLPLAYVLRAFDSVQIAAALRVRSLVTDVERQFEFCTADDGQAAAAELLGLAIRKV